MLVCAPMRMQDMPTSGTVADSDAGAELSICRNFRISLRSSRSARNISRNCGKAILPPVFARLSFASIVLSLQAAHHPCRGIITGYHQWTARVVCCQLLTGCSISVISCTSF